MKFYSIDEDIRFTLMELLQESLYLAKKDKDGDSVLLYTFLISELDSATLIDEKDDMMGQDLARLKKAERYIRLLHEEKVKKNKKRREKNKKQEDLDAKFEEYYNKRELRKKQRNSKTLTTLLADIGIRRYNGK